MIKDEQRANSRKAEDELKRRMQVLDKSFEEESVKCRENTSEMSRQYREMQESFNERIEVLQQQVEQAKQEIESVLKDIERVKIEKDELIRQKEAEIEALSH